MFDEETRKKGISIETNTGEQIDEVEATGTNIKKYMKDKKYPVFKKQ